MDDNNNIKKAPNVPPFLRYCSAIIPTAFDDSLSYYEALCALYKFLQDQVVTTINNNAAVTEEYIQMTKDMKSYMDNYFENLDVQEEINNKLDAMVEDGTLNTIIGSYVDEYVSETNDRLADVEGDISDLQSSIQDIEDESVGLLCIGRDGGTSDKWIVYSADGINFNSVKKLPSGIGGDSSSVIEIEGRFYLFGNNMYWYSEDLETWSAVNTIKSDYEYERIWGSSAYYDSENELIYIYSAYQYSNDTFTNAVGATTHYFKISYQTATINEDGTLNIDSTIHDLLYTVDESYIDPSVTKDKYLGLIFAYKDEKTCQVTTVLMNSLTSLSSSSVTNSAVGVEAPQLVSLNFGTVCYIDGYSMNNASLTNISGLPNVASCYRLNYKTTKYTQAQSGLVNITSDIAYRHLGITKCSKKAYTLLAKMGLFSYPKCNSSNKTIGNGVANYSINANNSVLVNFPCTMYSLTTNYTLVIKPYFKEIPIRLRLSKGITVTWSNDSLIQSSIKGKSFTPSEDVFLTIYPDARDVNGGMFLPINRD